MLKQITTLQNLELSTAQKIFFGVLIFAGSTVLFLLFPPPAIDWRNTFLPVARDPFHPYAIYSFVNLPWTGLILYPVGLFKEHYALAINASLNLVIIGLLVIKRKNDPWALLLTLTSFPFLSLLANGSIEWIPALGFIFQNSWGLCLLLTKPQTGLLAALAWIKASRNKIRFILPALLLGGISFFIWGNWLSALLANIHTIQSFDANLASWGISPFPWLVPVGLGLLFYIVKYRPTNGELLGTLATFCVVPYFAPHSLTIFVALLSTSHRRLAAIVWLGLWFYPVLKNWDVFLLILGFR